MALMHVHTLADGFEGPDAIFFLIVLIGVIASLLKRASAASKRSTLEIRRPQKFAKPKGVPEPRLPTISEFLRRLKEMSEEVETGVPPQGKTEQPTPRAVLPIPAPPRRATGEQQRLARPTPLRRPAVQEVETRGEPRPPEPGAGPAVPVTEPLEEKLQPSVAAAPFATPELDAYRLAAARQRRPAEAPEGGFSHSEVRKGIILAEILGRPMALRDRRPRVRRPEKARPQR